ncbi:endonuclease/exonuclease/phosphatase family protein [Alicyclobacillus mengziensis]|uniref:endonuclease/exonuclease/phosphatase family protein n=1 Tax=Alicyclobacillus mengziensis TaxID=2931921 RepID=UPI0020114AAB|nr:endonuclease/exonuclease/phosphatase family protein [Alicyclobacillus mengziensis]
MKAIRLALEEIDADIVALQEVWSDGNSSVVEQVGVKSGYRYMEFRQYPDDPKEGLAFLSKHPIESVSAIWATVSAQQMAIRAVFLIGEVRLAATNVHLDWRSILSREQEVVALDRLLTDQYSEDTYEVLCGDFNSLSESRIHRFLTGRQSLGNRTTLWTDIAEYYANRTGSNPPVTSANQLVVKKAQTPRNGSIASIELERQYSNSNEKEYKVFYWSNDEEVEAFVVEPVKPGHYPLLLNLHGGFAAPRGLSKSSVYGYTADTAYYNAVPNTVNVFPEYQGYMDSHDSRS